MIQDVRRLRSFQAVAASGSFSEAGLELGYAQSVISHHVAALEREVGLPLINRAVRPVAVTDAGARLLRHAEAILGHAAAAEDELRAVAGLEHGSLKVGAFLSACNSFLPRALALFEQAHPAVDLSFEQLEEPAALKRVRSGDLDLAVVWRIPGYPGPAAPERGSSFDEFSLAEDPYRVILPIRHRLARRDAVALSELGEERFAVPPLQGHGLPYRRMLDDLWAGAGIQPGVHEVQDVTVGRAMIAAGLGIGLLSELTMPEPRTDVAVLPLRGASPLREISVCWLRGRRLPAVARMVRFLGDAAGERLRPAGVDR